MVLRHFRCPHQYKAFVSSPFVFEVNMKFFAVALLLTVCIVQNASADLSNVRAYYSQQINTHVHTALERIRASASVNPAAQNCVDVAIVSLNSASFNGYNQLTSCVTNAMAEAEAVACCQQVLTSVINLEQVVSQEANSCVARS